MSKNTTATESTVRPAATRTVVNTKGALKVHRATCKKIRGEEALADTTATAAACCKPTAEMVLAAVDEGIETAAAMAAAKPKRAAAKRTAKKAKDATKTLRNDARDNPFTLDEALIVFAAPKGTLPKVAEQIDRPVGLLRRFRHNAVIGKIPKVTNEAAEKGRSEELETLVAALSA